jgi:hypothetical protein
VKHAWRAVAAVILAAGVELATVFSFTVSGLRRAIRIQTIIGIDR